MNQITNLISNIASSIFQQCASLTNIISAHQSGENIETNSAEALAQLKARHCNVNYFNELREEFCSGIQEHMDIVQQKEENIHAINMFITGIIIVGGAYVIANTVRALRCYQAQENEAIQNEAAPNNQEPDEIIPVENRILPRIILIAENGQRAFLPLRHRG